MAEFRFRQFVVRHDRCGMKVGTDGILLGAWSDVAGAVRILDVGSGSGLLALMLAQRNGGARIDAVELDREAAEQAAGNFRGSPWSGRLNLYCGSLREYLKQLPADVSYDRVVCNPPFFSAGSRPGGSARSLARHEGELTVAELITAASGVLAPAGRLSLILPVGRESHCLEMATAAGMGLWRRQRVRPFPESADRRVLLEFGIARGQLPLPDPEPLAIEAVAGSYTPAWRRLTGEFYL